MPDDDRIEIRPDLNGVHINSNVTVSMRDGIKLACDIYLPTSYGSTGDGRFPVLFSSTPYSKGRDDLVRDAKFFAFHGYASVLQDTRGRYQSE